MTHRSHRGDLSPADAIALQRDLAARVSLEPLDLASLRLVAGVDVSSAWRGRTLWAAAVVCRWPDLEVVATATARCEATFPYVPGLLSFREAPVILVALGRLAVRPDAILVDGQGLAHPRRFGLACHLGVLLDLPSVGVGKTRLVGEHREPGPRRGASVRLVDRGDVVGRVLRTRGGVKPLFVSPGHRIDLDGAARLVLRCARGVRQPEPTRRAHQAANAARRADVGSSS